MRGGLKLGLLALSPLCLLFGGLVWTQRPHSQTEQEPVVVSTKQGEARPPRLNSSELSSKLDDLFRSGDFTKAQETFSKLLRIDEDRALNYVETGPYFPSHFGDSLRSYFKSLPPELALSKSSRLAFNHRLEQHVITPSLVELLSTQRTKAMMWLEKSSNRPAVQNLAEELALAGTLGEPRQIVAEALSLEDKELSPRMIYGALQSMVYESPSEAFELLDDSPPSELFDYAITRLADQSGNTELSIALVETIENDHLRNLLKVELSKH